MKKRIAALLTVLALAVAAMIPAGIAEEAAEIVSPDPYEEIVAEFLQAKTVEPYQVIVRPTRVTGWANMNWAPSRSAPVLANYPAQTELTVLKETPNWLQVEYMPTGDVGFICREYTADPSEKKEENALNPTVEANGKTNLGVIDINGAFSIQCRLAEGYTIQPLKSTSDQLIAQVTSEDPEKPVIQLAVAYDEAYAQVERLNDVDDETLAVLEKTFTDMDPTVEITYGDTGLGTRLLIARMSDNGQHYLDIMSIYQGYFVECVLVPSFQAAEKTLTENQVQMCIDFLTEMDFVPADTPAVGAGAGSIYRAGQTFTANITDYRAETNEVGMELRREIILDAETVKALKTGDTFAVGQEEVTVETLEQDDEGDLLINDTYSLRFSGDEVRVYFYEHEYMETIDTIAVPVEDSLVFLDGIDPENGEMLDEPTEHTAAEFVSMLTEPAGVTFDLDNVLATFDDDGNLAKVERFYTPWQ